MNPITGIGGVANRALRDTAAYSLVRRLYDDIQIVQWIRHGRPAPPPAIIKRALILDYAQRFGLRTLVETGTFLGDTVAMMRSKFDTVYSVELDSRLYEQARQRFRGAANVRLLHGDSAEVLPRILAELHQPALFWLDGHFSGGITANGKTPLHEELEAVLDHAVTGHVVLIDDARCLGTGDYPTLEVIVELVHRHGGRTVEMSEDVVRICRR